MTTKVVGISKDATVYVFDGHTLEEAMDRVYDKLTSYQVHDKLEANYLDIQETSNHEFMHLKRSSKCVKKIKRKKQKKEKKKRTNINSKYSYLNGAY